jgi:hypothetical protein
VRLRAIPANGTVTPVSDTRDPWERHPKESAKAYGAFRAFRDLSPPARRPEDLAATLGIAPTQLSSWAMRWDWWQRAAAWDDEAHRIDDQERLEAIRAMHLNHRRAGRAAMLIAMQALQAVDPETIAPYAAARLLELGARLERSTLTVSVEELQGLDSETSADDPWEQIARELGSSR